MSDAPPAQPTPQPTPQPMHNNTTAVSSLILGILAVVFVPCGGLFPYSGTGAILAGGLALFLAVRGRRQIAASAGAQSGAGLATAGMVLGSIAIVLGIVLVILTAAVVSSGDIDSLVG